MKELDINKVTRIHQIGQKLFELDSMILATKNLEDHNSIRLILSNCKEIIGKEIIKIANGDSIDEEIMKALKSQPLQGVQIPSIDISELTEKVSKIEDEIKKNNIKTECECQKIDLKELEKQLIEELKKQGALPEPEKATTRKPTTKKPTTRRTTKK